MNENKHIHVASREPQELPLEFAAIVFLGLVRNAYEKIYDIPVKEIRVEEILKRCEKPKEDI